MIARLALMIAAFALSTPAEAYVSAETCAALPPVTEVASGQTLPLADVAKRIMADNDAVLVGERHGEATHITAFVCLLRELGDVRPTLVVEHLDADQQIAVTAFRKQFGETTSGLARTVNWAQSSWPAWGIYKPLFDYVWTARLPLVAGDLADAESDALLTNPAPLDEGFGDAAAQWTRSMMDAHCGLISDARAEALAGLQIARDRNMAQRMEAGNAGLPVLLAGRAHVRSNRSVPLHFRSVTKPATIALTARNAATDDAAYTYIWPVGESPASDTCARLKPVASNSNDQ